MGKKEIYVITSRYGTLFNPPEVFQKKAAAIKCLKCRFKEDLKLATDNMTREEARLFKEEQSIIEQDYYEIASDDGYYEGWLTACPVN